MNSLILFFVMQPLHMNNPELKDAVIQQADGFHVREKWSALNPSRGVFDFRWLDAQFDRAGRLNRYITLGIYEGTNSPTWLNVRKLGNGVPVPWDSRVVLANRAMIGELGKRYAGSNILYGVHISSPATEESMEFHFNIKDYRIVPVWKESIDAYAVAFPNSRLILDIAMIPDSRGEYTTQIVDYAKSRIGLRLVLIHCSLKASTDVNAPHHKFVTNFHANGGIVGFEMVGPSGNARFGGPFQTAIDKGTVAGASFFQIYQGDIQFIRR